MAEGNYIEVKLKDGTTKKIQIDEDGFIKDPKDWCEEFVMAVAREEGIDTLTEEHWKVIRYLRDYYLQYDSCPPIRMLVKNTGYDLKKIYQLFPTGPAKGACRLAGAPKPTGCV
ncbi:MAG: TusE/DsrC/DsvC family sulfur relay protein [Thermoplasmata archaeon]|jgi:tRNA 2-thiouridine synthesizing protein E|nr:TusE/DsrC/DsvC family sulfur relay protein [Euryarchaeota archaeon]MVT14812.1 TusE/DsrC/DsvC family sulfur relay protein [Euryarchaeota archaeon]MVT36092.1 TusE/DsrC/DsvC family sulfur relay protein [Euryarchaeota archaeon]